MNQYTKIPRITNDGSAAYQLNGAARDSWAQWLSSEPWDLFWTLTEAGMGHPELLTKRCLFLETSINESLYGKNFRRKGQGIETIWGIERQTRGSIHAHGLVRLPDHDVKDSSQFSLKYWQEFSSKLGFAFDKKTGKRVPGGFALLEMPRGQQDVVDYVTGYVIKDGELIIGPNFQPHSPRAFNQTLLGVKHGK